MPYGGKPAFMKLSAGETEKFLWGPLAQEETEVGQYRRKRTPKKKNEHGPGSGSLHRAEEPFRSEGGRDNPRKGG